MILETVQSEGLAHLSYLLGDDSAGVCAVIDPRRDVSVYLELARKKNCRITHILETHIHADFVSGSRELAAQTGAPIYVGEAPEYGFEHNPLKEGDCLELGSVRLKVLHTPGHTPEHVCYLVSGGKGSDEPWALFSGDTLFAGEVGRPDLLGGGSEERLARQLYHTFHDKLLKLGDQVEVYPGHGQGSPCGGSIGDRNTTTIGYERQFNPKLQPQSEDEFVKQVLTGLPPAPFYYPRMKKVNAAGPRVLGCIPYVQPLDPEAFRAAMGETERHRGGRPRDRGVRRGAHRRGAEHRTAGRVPYLGGLDPEARTNRLARAAPGVRPGRRPAAPAPDRHRERGRVPAAGHARMDRSRPAVPADAANERPRAEGTAGRPAAGEDGLQLLDVRRDDEWESGHLPTAKHVYAPYLSEHLDELDRERPVATFCGSGYRASLAASTLERNGFREVINIPGSMKAWKAAGFETVKHDGATYGGEKS